MSVTISNKTAERILAYMRLAQIYLDEHTNATADRRADLSLDTENVIEKLYRSRLDEGWHRYPQEKPENGEIVRIELPTGETFEDQFASGSWCAHADDEVSAWRRKP